LKGSLSVLKLIPGTYFNQTGNPLYQIENDSQINHSYKLWKKKKSNIKHLVCHKDRKHVTHLDLAKTIK